MKCYYKKNCRNFFNILNHILIYLQQHKFVKIR